MLFHTFHSQEERRAYGGSAFIEIQFCRLPFGTKLKHIVSIRSIEHWQDDSLFVDDEALFYKEYSRIFDCGVYNNLQRGTVDIFGINYYAPEQIDGLMEKLRADQPADHEILLEWLEKARQHNGFYILGI